MIFNTLKKLILPQNNLVRGAGGGLLRGPGGGLAGNTNCCCGVTNCEIFRGNAYSGDVHDHLSSIHVTFGSWGDAPAWSYAPGSTDNECCHSLASDYELPIRDYDTADPDEWAYFGNSPGMFAPNCLACHDCDSESGGTWAFLSAYCNNCSYAYPTGTCRSYIPDGSPDIVAVWTVELTVYGYFNSPCGTPSWCNQDVLTGAIGPKMQAVWAKTESASLTHVYSGHHVLPLVSHTSLNIGFSSSYYKDYYCGPPSSIDLYAEEPTP
jgi:hypothetical protein